MFIERTFLNEIEIAAWLESQGYEVVATSPTTGMDRALARTECGMTVCGNGYTYAPGGDRCDAWRPAPTARPTQPSKDTKTMNNDTGHTPGPWSAIPKGHDWLVQTPVLRTTQIGIVTELYNDDESAANAQLIAAAPELLAVLSECAKQLSALGATGHATRAREAIARATA